MPTLRGLFSRLFAVVAATAAVVSANNEKIIFVGPEAVNIPLAKPSLPELNLHTLTPGNSSIRTAIDRVFPAGSGDARVLGESTWVLLDSLAPGQRYEFRVCWSAMEPTSLTLGFYELDTVWQTPELVQSLAVYAYSRMPDPASGEKQADGNQNPTDERKASVLLVHIQAAADYFTDNAALMKDPPPVLVDLILDPYVFNAVPRSLLPTAGYLVVVTTVTWFVARWIASQLQSAAGVATDGDIKKKKKR